MSMCDRLQDGGPSVRCGECGEYIPLRLAKRSSLTVSIACPDCGNRQQLAGAEPEGRTAG